MNAGQLITITVTALLLIGGAAALGAASSAANDDRTGTTEGVGPSDRLPEQVLDHGSGIHETIESFLNGSVDTLGESLRDLLGNGEVADRSTKSAND